MPKIPGIPGPYWFFFYGFDCNEPMHVHVRRDRGFRPRDLNEIRRVVIENESFIIEAWHEHCGQR